MFGYKGFNKDFQCINGFQYEVGKTYELEDDIQVCHRGFHFCTDPLDVLLYYPPNSSRYALVRATGEIVHEDYKSCTNNLSILEELSLDQLIKLSKKKKILHKTRDIVSSTEDTKILILKGDRNIAVNVGLHTTSITDGWKSMSVNSGYNSLSRSYGKKGVAVTTGYGGVSETYNSDTTAISTGVEGSAVNEGACSFSVTTGESSQAVVKNTHSIAAALGPQSKAKGIKNTWLVLAEWEYGSPINVQGFLVDGDKVKEDTWYCLKDGKLCECE